VCYMLMLCGRVLNKCCSAYITITILNTSPVPPHVNCFLPQFRFSTIGTGLTCTHPSRAPPSLSTLSAMSSPSSPRFPPRRRSSTPSLAESASGRPTTSSSRCLASARTCKTSEATRRSASSSSTRPVSTTNSPGSQSPPRSSSIQQPPSPPFTRVRPTSTRASTLVRPCRRLRATSSRCRRGPSNAPPSRPRSSRRFKSALAKTIAVASFSSTTFEKLSATA
jgi:hypothetical protein